jgi:hypothetical protein
VRSYRDPLATASEWRRLAAAKQLSIRELIIEVTSRQSFIGSAATIAEQINHFVQSDASDGFILVPYITPGGLDPFVDQVVPVLQERGVFRGEYAGVTLRDHLGLGCPARSRRTIPSRSATFWRSSPAATGPKTVSQRAWCRALARRSRCGCSAVAAEQAPR